MSERVLNKISFGLGSEDVYVITDSAAHVHMEDSSVHVTAEEKTTWGGKQDKIDSSHKLDYSLISSGPTIPTVGSGTLTISQGGMSKGSFSANATDNASINLDAPTSITYGGSAVSSISAGVNVTMSIASGGVLTISASGGGGEGGVTPLTDITSLTGTSVTVEPGGAYVWSVSSDSILSISGGSEGKTGDCLLTVIHSGGSVSPGPGLSIATPLGSGATHPCAVRWDGVSATLYELGGVPRTYVDSEIGSASSSAEASLTLAVSNVSSSLIEEISSASAGVSSALHSEVTNASSALDLSIGGKVTSPKSSGSLGQVLMIGSAANMWKSLGTLTIVQGGTSSTFNPVSSSLEVVIAGGGGGGGGVDMGATQKIALIFG